MSEHKGEALPVESKIDQRDKDIAAYEKWHKSLYAQFGSYTINSQMDGQGSRFVMLEVIQSEEVLGRGKTWEEAYADASTKLPKPASPAPAFDWATASAEERTKKSYPFAVEHFSKRKHKPWEILISPEAFTPFILGVGESASEAWSDASGLPSVIALQRQEEQARRASEAELPALEVTEGKLIPLSNSNEFAIVDADEFEVLSKFTWRVGTSGSGSKCVVRTTSRLEGTPRHVKMHHELMAPPAGFVVDHANRNPLDNRHCNLRIASLNENQHNRGPQSGRKFKGVSSSKAGHFRYCISCDGKQFSKHGFTSEEDAARAYDAEARRLHGKFAYQNFPDSCEDQLPSCDTPATPADVAASKEVRAAMDGQVAKKVHEAEQTAYAKAVSLSSDQFKENEPRWNRCVRQYRDAIKALMQAPAQPIAESGEGK